MARLVGFPINSFYVRAVCGESEIRLTVTNETVLLSFLSTAEIMLDIELVKAKNPDLRQWVGR